MATTYFDIIDAVKNYYGSGSDQWVEIAKYGFSAENAESILKQVPGVNLIKNTDGSIRSWTYTAYEGTGAAGSSIPELINSNVQTGTANPGNSALVNIPANMGTETGGNITMRSGMATAGNFVMKEVVPAVAATGLGISLGKTISKAAYDAGFNWLSWAGVDLESLNPETWGSITSGDDSMGAKLFNMVFGIDPQTGTTQAYLDENAAAYMALYMQQVGMFSQPTEYAYKDDQTGFRYPGAYGHINISKECSINGTVIAYFTSGGENAYFFTNRFIQSNGSQSYAFYAVSNGTPATIWLNGNTYSFTGTFGNFYSPGSSAVLYPAPSAITNGNIGADGGDIRKIIWEGERGETGGVPGTGDQTGATLPDLSTATTPEQALQLLKQQYPDMFANPVTQTVVQPDGTIKEYHYIPINMPEGTSATDTDPTTGEGTQGNPQVNPDTATQTLIDLITQLLGDPATPTDTPDTGDGDTPPVVIPPGTANALYSIYNPTQGELNSFGAWLWSSNFVDQLLKLFNDPMQAIIGLHKVFAAPGISGASTIKVGYLDSGVSSNVVGSQYTTIDCGEISISEYFGNVFDYDPFTCVYIYLPFIGIEKLDTGDVMRGRLRVVYHVDVLNGACLAEIRVTRDGAGGTLYTYAGNCAVQYPISSGSYMGIVASMASVAGGVVGTIASGGALAPVAMGAVSGVLNAHTRVQHSGGFSGNAGAMGIKTPYVIITRPQTCLADNFPAFDGYPANKSTTLSACSGFVKVESCHVSGIPATDAELSEIEMLLKSGVII